MELRHLRYFVAVAEELSFTKAAAKAPARPAVAHAAGAESRGRNRREIAGPLEQPRRAHRGRALFLFDSKKLLAMCAESVAAVQRMNRGESSQLNIGYVANIHYGLLPATLGAFRKLCPRVALNLFDMTSAEQFQALDGRKIDLGFVGLRPRSPATICSPNAWRTTRCSSPFRPAIRSRRSRRIKLADLAPQFFIGMSARPIPAPGNGCSRPARAPDSPGGFCRRRTANRPRSSLSPTGWAWPSCPSKSRAAARRRGLSPALSAAPPRIDHRLARRQSLQAAQGLHPDREGDRGRRFADGRPRVLSLAAMSVATFADRPRSQRWRLLN
jgi:hypothetical protein